MLRIISKFAQGLPGYDDWLTKESQERPRDLMFEKEQGYYVLKETKTPDPRNPTQMMTRNIPDEGDPFPSPQEAFMYIEQMKEEFKREGITNVSVEDQDGSLVMPSQVGGFDYENWLAEGQAEPMVMPFRR